MRCGARGVLRRDERLAECDVAGALRVLELELFLLLPELRVLRLDLLADLRSFLARVLRSLDGQLLSDSGLRDRGEREALPPLVAGRDCLIPLELGPDDLVVEALRLSLRLGRLDRKSVV